MKFCPKQQGMTLIMLIFIVGIVAIGYLLHALSPTTVKNERDKKTTMALAEAKAALIGYATAVDLTIVACATNCRRPGDLPCPDTNNDGIANTPCNGSTVGRLPWKSLGLGDLRDGDGEFLWYAVSENYKNNPRTGVLNSDSNATITTRSASGIVVNNGSMVTGVVAVILAPGAAITREDDVVQVRDNANENIALNYLDIALGEDNQNFVDVATNGFIEGPIRNASGEVIVNDHLLAITREELNQAMEARVMGEVRNALINYYTVNNYFPNAASFNDITCLGAANIPINCLESTATHGRIPANPDIAWNATSILRGMDSNNWFQQNGWREVIHYAVAPPCATGNMNCGGVGMLLTLGNALVAPDNTKQVVIIATGKAIGAQTHADPILEANYLENENQTPLDGIYARTVAAGVTFNDYAVSIP